MRPIRALPLLLALATGAACINPTEDLQVQGPLSIQAGQGTLRLGNRTSEPIYTFVVERETAALIDWAVCTDPARCDGIAPDAVRSIPYAEINGYEPGKQQEAIVYWYHLKARAGGGFQPDSIRTEIVRL